MNQPQDNPYLTMPLDRVRSDALHGVRLARIAWRSRDSEGAAKELGRIIEPGHERDPGARPMRIVFPDKAKRVRRKAKKARGSKKTRKITSRSKTGPRGKAKASR